MYAHYCGSKSCVDLTRDSEYKVHRDAENVERAVSGPSAEEVKHKVRPRKGVSWEKFWWKDNMNDLVTQQGAENDEPQLPIRRNGAERRPLLWSSVQEFLAVNPEVPGSIFGAARFSE
jgi:hypothetical protein